MTRKTFAGFSALQRAENSSIRRRRPPSTARAGVSVLFSDPKIPQFPRLARSMFGSMLRFSALQRAENSSNRRCAELRVGESRFQCSSASRKFLKQRKYGIKHYTFDVSVLFSEPKIPQNRRFPDVEQFGFVSVLFSEPKIPQTDAQITHVDVSRVSVLFSEPKIPQSKLSLHLVQRNWTFQCSSASRKFLKSSSLGLATRALEFQCSSASRKFLKFTKRKIA